MDTELHSMLKKPEPGKPQLSFQEMSRLAKSRAHEYAIQSLFKFGYRNKEDISNLPPSTLVVGSQNVLTNAAEQITIRNGYQLDGPAGNQNTYGIDSSYDFQTKIGTILNLRKWGPNLEFRYVNPITQAVTWLALSTSLNVSKICSFTNFWDANTEVSMFMLMANGDNKIYEWTGGVASFASATSNTITVQGSASVNQLGFYSQANNINSGKATLNINGITYSYTASGSNTTQPVNSTTNAHQDLQLSPTKWAAQSFTTGANAQSITSAVLAVYLSNDLAYNAVNLTAGIYTDNAGNPGTLVGVVSTSAIPVSLGKVAAGTYSVTFNFQQNINGASILPLTVSQNTTYHFVVYSDQINNFFSIYGSTSSATSGTQASTNRGSTWSANTGPLYLTINENNTFFQTFIGVSPDPTGAGIQVGDPVFQSLSVGVSAQGINGLPSNGTTSASSTASSTNFTNIDLIENLGNQIWYGNLNSPTIYVSKVNAYQDITSSSPARLPGEGALINLDSPVVAFSPQATEMYISSGRSEWWISQTLKNTYNNSGANVQTEILYASRLKTAHNQAAQSNALVARFKNSLVYVSNEQIINSLGLVKNVYTDPQVVNMSDPIKYDVDAYNFSGGQVYYDDYFIYITLPAMGVVRIYNVIKKYWEAPQLLPISRFYHLTSTPGSTLYGHSSLTNESYQMFTGYNDNGNPISAIAAFPYVSAEGGAPFQLKNFNKHYTEGYISGNTTLTLTINYDFGGFSGNYSQAISGSDSRIIFNKITDGSLGQNPLGNQPIGSILNITPQPAIPKFRVINTFPRVNCFEYQLVYSSDDVDQNWALLRLGPAAGPAPELPVQVTK